jgi:hypothetical protein
MQHKKLVISLLTVAAFAVACKPSVDGLNQASQVETGLNFQL